MTGGAAYATMRSGNDKVDYHDTSVLTRAVKQSKERIRVETTEKAEMVQTRTRWFVFYGVLLVSTWLCAALCFVSRWMFVFQDAQSLLSVDGDRYLRSVKFEMGFNGLLIFIEFTQVETGAGPFLDVDKFLPYDQPDAWNTEHKMYDQAVSDAAEGSTALLLCMVLCLVSCLAAALVLTFATKMRNTDRCTFVMGMGMIGCGGCVGGVGLVYFILQTGDLRSLLASGDDPVANDTKPILMPGYGLYGAVVVVCFSLLQLLCFYKSIPEAAMLLEPDEKITAKHKERNARIRQYLDDVTNDTFLREKYTVMPEPDLSADRPAAGARRPNLLPPLKGFDKDKAVKLAAPASVTAEKGFSKGCTKKSATKSEKIKECEKDLEPEETVMEDALPGSVPDSSSKTEAFLYRPAQPDPDLIRPISPMKTQKAQLDKAGRAQLMITQTGDSLLLPGVDSKAASYLASLVAPPVISEETVVGAFNFRQSTGITDLEALPPGSRPMTRQRPVSRAPVSRYWNGQKNKSETHEIRIIQ